MLFQLGTVAFEIAPFNPQETSRETEAGIVSKPVLGRRPPLEFVGDGPESISISAVLFPETLGGLEVLDRLDAMRAAGAPQYFMRGDGRPMGWFMIEKVSEKSTFLDHRGIGRQVSVEISLRRSDAPQASDFFSSIMGLLS